MSQQPMMRQTIARKLGLDIAALTRDPASGQQLPGLVPTLFIGIGGSGALVLGRVKKRMRLGPPGEMNCASFLLIDTDPSGLGSASPLFDQQETVGCPFPAGPNGEDPATLLPVRARGHQAYVANYDAIDHALASAFRRLPPPDWRGAAEGPKLHPERTAVVIVGSLWSVTASGMVIDVAYHMGRIAPQAWKAAYLLMPGAYDPLAEQEDPSMAFANAYAALAEVNYLATIDPATGTEGTLWVDGPGGEPMKYKGAPWERCYLVEGANADSVAQLYESNCAMLGDALFWDMTFVLGAWKWALRDRLGYAAMRTGGGPFASFGMASLRFPRERVVATCSRRFTEQLLTRWIGNVSPPADAAGTKTRPPLDAFLEQHGEWKSGGLIKRLAKLRGKGVTSVEVAIAEWARPLADEAEVKKHGRNVGAVLLKEWQRMDVSHFSPKADGDGWGPKIDANVAYRAEKYKEGLEEAIQVKLKYEAPGWQGLQGIMGLLEDLGKRVASYGPKYEEQLPKLKKAVAERKEEVLKAADELSKLCSNPITFPFSGAKVQSAAGSFAASAQAHLHAHLELRATATAGRLARKLIEECRAAFERQASARDVIAHARSMIKQQEDPEPVVGDVYRPEAIDELFARAFPPEVPAATGAPTKKLNADASPFQLASKRIAIELGCDSLSALLERIRAGEVLAGMLAEIAVEEGRRAFAPFANTIDFVDHYKRTFTAPEEQALGMAETYFRAAPYVRFSQVTAAGVLVGVNGMAFTEDGYKAIGPLLQAVPLKETEVGLVPLQEGEDEGVVYYREVAGLHITSLPSVTEAQPCYDWIVSQGIAGLHISRPVEEPPALAPESEYEAPVEAGLVEAGSVEPGSVEMEVGRGAEPDYQAQSGPAGRSETGLAGTPEAWLSGLAEVGPSGTADAGLTGHAEAPSPGGFESTEDPPDRLPASQVEADPFEAIVTAALRENGSSGAPDVAPAGEYGAPYIAPAGDSGAPYIAPAGDYGAPYIAPAGDSGAPYIAPAGDSGAPYIAPAGDSGALSEQPAIGPSRPLTGNAAALRFGVDDTPFDVTLDPAALGDVEGNGDTSGFSFDPFK